MKEAFGGISLFQIVIVFLLLFTGIMCLTINHSKAFGVKDEIINIIENEKLDNLKSTQDYKLKADTIGEIVNKLNEIGYRNTGKCPDENWIGYDRNEEKVSNSSAAFCIRAVNVTDAYYEDIKNKCKNDLCNPTYDDFPIMVYYDIILFYQLDIPILNDVMNFKLYGSTKVLFG